MKAYEEESVTIYQGDCLLELQSLQEESIQCCVTSPPYWGLRDYGVDGQIGLEKSLDEYVKKMVAVFSQIKRVLKKDGTLWLNLGDCYAGSWGNYSPNTATPSEGWSGTRFDRRAYDDRTWRPSNSLPQKGLKAKDLVGIPWRVAFALQAEGWYLRQDIIWSKPNPMPESVTDRCTKSHEYIFLLSKSERYHFDNSAILEPAKYSEEAVYDNGQNGLESGKSYAGTGSTTRKFRAASLERKEDAKRNKRSVWNVAVKPYREAHFATFPTELIRPCILAGCPAGSIVLDPFLGSGTTAFVSKELNRRCIGIELNSKYISLAKGRLIQEVLNFNTEEDRTSRAQEPPQDTVEQASTDMQQVK